MFVPFDQLRSDSRTWVYLSDRVWNSEEVMEIESAARSFLNEWTAHQQALSASCKTLYQRFLVLAVDQQTVSASGCSIDKSVAFVRGLEERFNCRMMDRMLFAYKQDGAVRAVSKQQFEELVESGGINDQTVVFDNLVDTVQALNHRWEIPFERSWHKVLVG